MNNGEFFRLVSELYFLIAKFLLNSPFKDVAQVRYDATTSQLWPEIMFNQIFFSQKALIRKLEESEVSKCRIITKN